MSDSGQPHRRQPTRLPSPWDSPGKNKETEKAFIEGKLVVPDAALLTGIREKITTFTDAIVGKQAAKPSGSEFSLIREQLIRQRDAIL